MASFSPLFELQGARGFEAALEKASDEVRKNCERVSQRTAFRVRARAKANLVAQGHVAKGDLYNAIEAQGKGMNWKVGLLDTSIPSRGGSDPSHWNPYVYGVWYEFGFRSRGIATRPYMAPAAEAEEQTHQDEMAAAVNAGLQGLA